MNDMEFNNLAIRLLRMLKNWIDTIIPEETKDCIRSKVAIVVAVNSGNTYNVILSEELGDYLELVRRRDMKEGDADYDASKKLTAAQFKQELDKISIDNLFSIKNEQFAINDYVIVGYLDNKLTNAFILCKNKK